MSRSRHQSKASSLVVGAEAFLQNSLLTAPGRICLIPQRPWLNGWISEEVDATDSSCDQPLFAHDGEGTFFDSVDFVSAHACLSASTLLCFFTRGER
jgi:hypothetical protein